MMPERKKVPRYWQVRSTGNLGGKALGRVRRMVEREAARGGGEFGDWRMEAKGGYGLVASRSFCRSIPLQPETLLDRKEY